jgi:hypothetical protein
MGRVKENLKLDAVVAAIAAHAEEVARDGVPLSKLRSF